MISLSEVRLGFGTQVLVERAGWHLHPGAHYGLVGANGTGKSTLLRVLAGDLEPEQGSVSRPNQLRIGMLRQEQTRHAKLPLLDVVMMGRPALWAALQEKEALLARVAGHGPGATPSDAEGARLGALEAVIADQEGYAAEAVAGTLLAGLGIDVARHRRPLAELSGGYRLRVLLAQTLFSAPELLLLDEPTNHLDIVSIRWLEQHLRAYPHTFVLVSHDRHFLNAVCDQIVDIDYQELTVYPGNYDAFCAAKALAREQKEAEIARLEKKTAEMQRFVDRFRAKATKARQAQSRQKQIDRMEAPEIRRSSRRHPAFRFTTARPSGREVLRVQGLGKGFGGTPVIEGLSFELMRGEKMAVVGPNGVGKSTLLNMLAGRLEPDSGGFELGYEVQPGFFAQDHHLLLKGRGTVYDWLHAVKPMAEVGTIRGILGRVLFSGDDAAKRIAALSGGESARLVLASLMLREDNLLLLDEPTNHLDLEGREALMQALIDYPGTLVFVSHDRHFVSAVARRVLVLSPEGGEDFAGTYEDYLARQGIDFLTESAAAGMARGSGGPAVGGGKADHVRRKRQRRDLARLRRRVADLEARVAGLEVELERMGERFAQAAYFQETPPEQIRTDERQRRCTERQLEATVADWEAAAQELEAAEAG